MEFTDKILFGMPKDPELWLAALAAVQDYGWQLARQLEGGRRQGEWLLAIHSPNPRMEFLYDCFPDGVMFVDEWEPRRGEWDFVYKFDEQLTYEVALPIKQTAALTFGMLIGAAPPSELPDLKKWKGTQSEWDVVIINDFDAAQELGDLIEIHFSDLSVKFGEEVQKAGELVIGRRSFETYLAASLGVRVVELYPPDENPKWLSKWSGSYQQVYGNEFPVGLIWRAVEEVFERWPMHRTMPTT